MIGNIQEKIEDKIIDCINMGAEGRLVIIKAGGKGGKDLVIEKKGEYDYNRKIYLSVNLLPKKDSLSPKDIGKKDLKSEEDFYFIFLYFDEVSQQINNKIWVIPSLKFEKDKEEKSYLDFAMDKNKLGDFLLNVFGKIYKPDHSKDFLKRNII